MNQEECREVERALDMFLNESLERVLLSNPTNRDGMVKSRLRPMVLKGRLMFQAEELVGKQAFHRNMEKDEAVEYVKGLLEGRFRQMEIASANGSALVLVSKKGTVTVKVKGGESGVSKASGAAGASRLPKTAGTAGESGLPKTSGTAGASGLSKISVGSGSSLAPLSHNRKKQYILEEGRPVPFLVDLGVMTKEGKVVSSHYDKYRQINRFLEFIEDILPSLDQEKETTIIDFGCGKSYLTFAMYYYLKVLREYPVHIIGLDLKQDVIDHCSRLGKQYGYDRLDFQHGDIASYEGVDRVDMVVTLHACDTATDFALQKAVGWGAKVILSVPCCQHELAKQIENEQLKPVLQYGLIRERMAALYTDAIRAQVLEYRGYRTQILEFIDMEHTPKNILIRAIFQDRKKDNGEQIRELIRMLGLNPSVVKLLAPELGPV